MRKNANKHATAIRRVIRVSVSQDTALVKPLTSLWIKIEASVRPQTSVDLVECLTQIITKLELPNAKEKPAMRKIAALVCAVPVVFSTVNHY